MEGVLFGREQKRRALSYLQSRDEIEELVMHEEKRGLSPPSTCAYVWGCVWYLGVYIKFDGVCGLIWACVCVCVCARAYVRFNGDCVSGLMVFGRGCVCQVSRWWQILAEPSAPLPSPFVFCTKPNSGST